jgi:transposase
MRKCINGLTLLIQNSFDLDPFEQAVFVFCNRSKDRLKILEWDGNGFWLYLKRLEYGHFPWPSVEDDATMNLTDDELMQLLMSPGIIQKLTHKELGRGAA